MLSTRPALGVGLFCVEEALEIRPIRAYQLPLSLQV